MRFIFVVDDEGHDKAAGLNIKKEAKLNKVSTDSIINDICDGFWEFAQSYELSCYTDDIIEKEAE
jgi:hypothetical protein